MYCHPYISTKKCDTRLREYIQVDRVHNQVVLYSQHQPLAYISRIHKFMFNKKQYNPNIQHFPLFCVRFAVHWRTGEGIAIQMDMCLSFQQQCSSHILTSANHFLNDESPTLCLKFKLSGNGLLANCRTLTTQAVTASRDKLTIDITLIKKKCSKVPHNCYKFVLMKRKIRSRALQLNWHFIVFLTETSKIQIPPPPPQLLNSQKKKGKKREGK